MITYLVSTLRRDIQEKLVFRWSLALQLVSTTTMLLVFFLIDRFQGHFIGHRLGDAAALLNTSYFGYVSLGLAVSALASSGVGGIPGQLQEERSLRTLEYLIASPVSIHRWAVVTGLCNLLHAFLQFVIIFTVAVLIMRLQVPRFHAPLALVLLVVSMVPLWCLSVLTLASTLIFRRGNPFAFILATSFELLGGVYVPQSVLPGWLSRCGELLPITPAVRAMQKIVYGGAGFPEVSSDMLQLLVLTLVYLPLALVLLGKADRLSRKNGTYCLS